MRIDVPRNNWKNNLPIGTVLRMNGYNYDEYVIVKNLGIDENFEAYGTRYLTVSLTDYTQHFMEAYQLKYISEKKNDAIQIYILNKVLEPDKVLSVWEKSEKIRKQKEQEQRKKAEEEKKLEKIGRELFKKYIPQEAKALIVAKFEVDDSDLMTDYYATREKNTVILGYSLHTRDLFSEMRKFADRIPETKHLAKKERKFEHREKYTYGAGYYLKDGSRYSTGWKIQKEKKYGNDWSRELYISMAKRCVFKELSLSNSNMQDLSL